MMRHKFEILTDTTVYIVWGNSLFETKDKYIQEKGEDCEVFFSGNCPKFLSLAEYKKAMAVLGNNHRLVMIYDKKVGKLLNGW